MSGKSDGSKLFLSRPKLPLLSQACPPKLPLYLAHSNPQTYVQSFFWHHIDLLLISSPGHHWSLSIIVRSMHSLMKKKVCVVLIPRTHIKPKVVALCAPLSRASCFLRKWFSSISALIFDDAPLRDGRKDSSSSSSSCSSPISPLSSIAREEDPFPPPSAPYGNVNLLLLVSNCPCFSHGPLINAC